MTDAEPQLQPPGAGLPRAELFFSRLGFRLATPFLSRQRASRWVRSEADRMLARVRTLAPRGRRPPGTRPALSGLEDSSRYWSALMTLEHFVIVNTAVAGIIEALAAGRVARRGFHRRREAERDGRRVDGRAVRGRDERLPRAWARSPICGRR